MVTAVQQASKQYFHQHYSNFYQNENAELNDFFFNFTI